MVKNKVAPPFRQVDFQILYGEGISGNGELIELGVKHKLVTNPVLVLLWVAVIYRRENKWCSIAEHPEQAAILEQKITFRIISKSGKKHY